MNGVASAHMRKADIGYKLNFGVGIPALRQIASETEKDAGLAQALWKENIREPDAGSIGGGIPLDSLR